MSSDFVLYEGPMGYALFQVVHKSDVVGNRLKEVQDAAQDLAKFGKMVKLQSFLPFEYDSRSCRVPLSPTNDFPADLESRH